MPTLPRQAKCPRLDSRQIQDRLRAFLAEAHSIFGSLEFTGFIIGSHLFTIPLSLAPHRVMLAVPLHPHGFGFIL